MSSFPLVKRPYFHYNDISRLWSLTTRKAVPRIMQTFARWVSTPETGAARQAVGRVADRVLSGRPRREANPLFLHGPSGIGKTHLVAALAHELARRGPELTMQTVAAREL